MNQTEHEAQGAAASDGGEERIRKVYAKDLKNGESIFTVFRATAKERHTSRAGKTYLSMRLSDRTGEVDARIFENVDVADTAVADGDYLLVQGKVGSFHGKSQVVIDRLERLDPEPIDPKEFEYVRPPEPPPAPPAAEERERPAKKLDEREVKLPKRLQRLLAEPQVAQALDALMGYLDRLVEEKVAARLGGERQERPERQERAERHEKRPRPPKAARVEAERPEKEKPEAKEERRRDASLPEGLAFKPFTELVGDGSTAEPAQQPTE